MAKNGGPCDAFLALAMLVLSATLVASALPPQSELLHGQNHTQHVVLHHDVVAANYSTPTPSGSEVAALLALKTSIHNDSHGYLANWTIGNASNACLTWFGITCSSEGRVIGIDLSWSYLEGTVTAKVGDLVHLKSLNLCFNSLHGSVPQELLTLPKIEKLFLGFNNFSGPVPEVVDDGTSCQALTYLDLRFNHISGSIPHSLGRCCRYLQSLYLSSNRLSGSVPSSFGELTQLEELWLDNNTLTGQIPSELGSMTELKWLFMSNNNLRGSVPPELGNLASLQVLDLSGNALSGTIPSSLCRRESTLSIDVDDQGISLNKIQCLSNSSFQITDVMSILGFMIGLVIGFFSALITFLFWTPAQLLIFGYKSRKPRRKNMPYGSTMGMKAAIWSNLPPEILERVLSFAPVPDLCRYRTVCKTWNRLISGPKFASLHCTNTLNQQHTTTFIVMSFSRRFKSSSHPSRKTSTHTRWCILDVHARRWYTATYNTRYRFKTDCDIMAMDKGLVCQYLETKSQSNSIIVHNPIANMAKVLPTAPDHMASHSFPELSLVVDPTSHAFKVILINHSFSDKELKEVVQNDPFVRVYDTATNAWQSMKNPGWISSGVGHIRRSIMFQGLLYVLSYGGKEYQFWRYSVVEDAWEKLAVPVSGDCKCPEIVVNGSSLFLVAWYCKRFCLGLDGGLRGLRERRWFCKLVEIKVPSMARETVFDYSKAKMVALLGVERVPECDKYLHMSVVSFRRSLLFMCNSSGRLVAFDLVTRKWDCEWPHNPLGQRLPDEEYSWVGEHMNLLLPSASLW